MGRRGDDESNNRRGSRSRSSDRNDKHSSRKRNDSNERRKKENNRRDRSSSSSSSSGSHDANEILKQQQIRSRLIQEELGYTQEENPFGDRNISETILQNWGTKRKVKSLEENQRDIQNIKAIRAQRIEDEKRLEEERTKQQREREEETYQQWALKEESFHAYQARIRALVRITQGKETKIDKINKIFYIYRGKIRYSEHLESIMKNIPAFIRKQDEDELEKILAQAINHHNQLSDPAAAVADQLYKDEEQAKRFSKFWESVKQITSYWLEEVRATAITDLSQRKNILPEFEADVKMIFEGKTLEQLMELEKEIATSVSAVSYSASDELTYWQNMQKRLQLYKGDAILKEFYQNFIQFEKDNQTEDALEIEVENKVRPTEDQILATKIIEEQEIADAHLYSPVLAQLTAESVRHAQSQQDFVDQTNELRQLYYSKILKRALAALEAKREKDAKCLIDAKSSAPSSSTKQDREEIDEATLKLLEMEKKKPLEDDEIIFDDVQQLGEQVYEWSDKYKSKKPRYFNRVKQGFDWNKYNQMHFDVDNPPPKYIQGYKFNVFYPQLIDNSKTPEYFLEKSDEPGYCIIRFAAGAPYEDLAFKILNKEWDYADKKGFRCFFNRGVLTLHFNFKRNRYRR